MKIKNEKGITLVALAITIIVLLIIAGIGYNYGKEAIQKAQLEELRTNMLLIEAKAKGLVEEVNFKIGLTKVNNFWNWCLKTLIKKKLSKILKINKYIKVKNKIIIKHHLILINFNLLNYPNLWIL